MKFGVIVAARFSSRRLPGKALLPLAGLPMLEYLFRRLRSAEQMAPVFFATSNGIEDNCLAELASRLGVPTYRGDRDDVVSRFVGAAEFFKIDFPIRITGDCPFLDSSTLRFCIEQAQKIPYFDIATTKGAFPVGIDLEIYSHAKLKKLHEAGGLTPEEREHLTLRFYNNETNFKVLRLVPPREWPSVPTLGDAKFTIDTPADYEFAVKLLAPFSHSSPSVAEILSACAN